MPLKIKKRKKTKNQPYLPTSLLGYHQQRSKSFLRQDTLEFSSLIYFQAPYLQSHRQKSTPFAASQQNPDHIQKSKPSFSVWDPSKSTATIATHHQPVKKTFIPPYRPLTGHNIYNICDGQRIPLRACRMWDPPTLSWPTFLLLQFIPDSFNPKFPISSLFQLPIPTPTLFLNTHSFILLLCNLFFFFCCFDF